MKDRQTERENRVCFVSIHTQIALWVSRSALLWVSIFLFSCDSSEPAVTQSVSRFWHPLCHARRIISCCFCSCCITGCVFSQLFFFLLCLFLFFSLSVCSSFLLLSLSLFLFLSLVFPVFNWHSVNIQHNWTGKFEIADTCRIKEWLIDGQAHTLLLMSRKRREKEREREREWSSNCYY